MNTRTSLFIVILFTYFVGLSLQASSHEGSDSASPNHSVSSSPPHGERLGIKLYNDPPYMRSSPRPPPKHVRPPSPEHAEQEVNDSNMKKQVMTKVKKATPSSSKKEEENQSDTKKQARTQIKMKKHVDRLKNAEPSSQVSSQRRHH